MKRVFAFLLAFVMLVSFAACDSKDGSSKKSDGTGETVNAENQKKLSAYVVEGYKPINSTNDEGKIIAALDKTLFGTRSMKVSVAEYNEEIFEGYIDLGETLASSGLYFEIDGGETNGAVYDGNLIAADSYYNEHITADIKKIAASDEEEINSFLLELTGHSADEWVEELKTFGIDISTAKVLGWVSKIVDGRINEDVVAEIFDEVAIPYAVAMVNSYGYEIDAKDIPDFKTLKGIVYEFFLNGHASSALEITVNGDEYEVALHFGEFIKNAVEFVSNHEKLQGIVNSQLGQEFIEMLNEDLEYISEEEDLLFTVELENGYISKVEFYDVEIELSDFNEFTGIKEDYEDLVEDTADSELEYSVNNLSDIIALF